MTHPLQSKHGMPIHLGKPYGGVRVKRIGNKLLRLEPGEPIVTKADTLWLPFEQGRDLSVVNVAGAEIRFHGAAYISATTFDPFHVVCDFYEATGRRAVRL